MKKLITIAVFLFCAVSINAQVDLKDQLEGYYTPEEIVSLSQNVPFSEAMEILSNVSEKLVGKKIVSTAGITTPIGIQIDNMPYKKALLIISQYNNLTFEERENVIVVKKKNDPTADLSDDVYAPVEAREVKISAVFFEANISEMRERGINWQLLLQKSGFSIGPELKTFLQGKQATDEEGGQEQQESPPDFVVGSEGEFDLGSFTGNALGAFKFFETENLGEIIARPTIKVRDKQKGRIQIGSDISIKQRDFAGNVIDIFVSTGTIIEVIPYIYKEDGVDYVLMKLNVERSTANPDIISTEIKKTTASTDILMLDGEETVIGGLFVNEDNNIRRGIPVLKDLPWWVLGLRYLTGYDQHSIRKQEVIILIQTEIVPTLKERVTMKKSENLLKEEIEVNHDELNRLKVNKPKAQGWDK